MRILLACLGLVLGLSTAHADTPRRVALVVANGAYAFVPELANPPRDAALVAGALRAAGYEVVTAADAGHDALRAALTQFATTARGADTALVYLAGHGVLDRGASYFIATDAPRDLAYSVAEHSVSVTDVFAALTGARRRVVLFDACRDSPFRVLRAPQPRGVGFALDSTEMRGESYLAHAARRGAVAADGVAGGNSPFATALAARLGAGDDFAAMLARVQADVAAATEGRQEPALLLPPSGPRPPAAGAVAAATACAGCPPTAYAPAGPFQFGSPASEAGRDADETAPVTVTIGAFDITRHEVTRDAFAQFVADTGRIMAQGCEARTGEGATITQAPDASWRAPGYEQSGAHPVVCVDWQDARDYARWLSAKTGRTWRLPSEAEWEYAARAGAVTPYFWGADRATCPWGNGDDLTAPVLAPAQCRDGFRFTAPVGSFQPNAWGLYDTAGNVWEWTLDCDDGAASPPPADGAARVGGACANRTIRGGSFDYGPNFLRSASRHRLPPDARNASVGFRLVRER